MSADRKKAAIIAFVQGNEAIRRDVREDALAMLAKVPLEVLGDADALEEFLTELLEAILKKHIVTPDLKVHPRVAAAIRGYVRGMTAGE